MKREAQNADAIGGMRRPHISIAEANSGSRNRAGRLRTIILNHLNENHSVLEYALPTLEGKENVQAPERDPALFAKIANVHKSKRHRGLQQSLRGP